uniref:Uncharacterized protein n=1 Tax=Knipowitschia caucasica TaxID=637954 RepID=A0AAV2MJ85_KNICA
MKAGVKDGPSPSVFYELHPIITRSIWGMMYVNRRDHNGKDHKGKDHYRRDHNGKDHNERDRNRRDHSGRRMISAAHTE